MLKSGQRGIALITAIFVVTLATIAAVAMVEVSNVSVHRSANMVLSETEWWYASGVESWVKGVLAADAKINKGGAVVGLNGLWAKPVDFLPIDGGGLRGHIDDLQGRFNLNNLATPPGNGTAVGTNGGTIYTAQFERLLDNLPNFDASKYHGLANAIRDWVDGDDQRSGTDGAEDQDYLSQDPPYRAANQGMHSVSELLLVRGMTKELYAALAPYVTALPGVTKINVNTAPGPVLMSLSPNVDQREVQKFIETRKSDPVSNASDIKQLLGAQVPNQPPVPTDVTSNYFGLQAEVSIGSGRLALYSVIYRPTGGGTPMVLAHSTNTQ
ncbi:MAG TPA: type II secretion system minor pseudopilin GspK [Nevskia sp.]|nr:type II secretion system minor pseudopilin GspK [Nevskia sp.]